MLKRVEPDRGNVHAHKGRKKVNVATRNALRIKIVFDVKRTITNAAMLFINITSLLNNNKVNLYILARTMHI